MIGTPEEEYGIINYLESNPGIFGRGAGNTCGAAAFPADQAIKVIARVVDFFVWPATLRDTNENSMGPMDQMNCVQ